MRSPGLATAGVGVPLPAIAHQRKSTTRASSRGGESFPSPTWAGKPLAPPLPRSGVSVPPSAPEEGRPVPRSRRSCVGDGGGGEVKGGTKGWIHFVGIGGCGLSALAMLALEQAFTVPFGGVVKGYCGTEKCASHKVTTCFDSKDRKI